MEPNRFEAIRNKTTEVLAKAQLLYGVDLKPVVSFNLRGRVAGWAGCKNCAGQRVYTLRYNRELIAGNHFEDIRDNTVAHEIAHLVCYARPELGRNHDAGWRRVCVALGGNGKSSHDYKVTYANGSWDYISTRGHKITISNIRHKKVQQGTVYTLKNGLGRIDRSCRFAPSGRPMPENPPNGRVVAELRVPAGWAQAA